MERRHETKKNMQVNVILERLELSSGIDPNTIIQFMSRGGSELVQCTIGLARSLSDEQGDAIVSDKFVVLKLFSNLYDSYRPMQESFRHLDVNVRPPERTENPLPFLSFFGLGPEFVSDFRCISEEQKLATAILGIHTHLVEALFNETGWNRNECGPHWDHFED